MTPMRVSFQDGTKQRERGRLLQFVPVGIRVMAVVEVRGNLRVMNPDRLKVLRGKR